MKNFLFFPKYCFHTAEIITIKICCYAYFCDQIHPLRVCAADRDSDTAGAGARAATPRPTAGEDKARSHEGGAQAQAPRPVVVRPAVCDALLHPDRRRAVRGPS